MQKIPKLSSTILKFEGEFERYAHTELNIANPFTLYWRDTSKVINQFATIKSDGSVEIDEEAFPWLEYLDSKTEVSREQWRKMKSKYVANKILRELGYEALIISGYIKYFLDALPCDGKIPQCRLDCPQYENCPYKNVHTINEN